MRTTPTQAGPMAATVQSPLWRAISSAAELGRARIPEVEAALQAGMPEAWLAEALRTAFIADAPVELCLALDPRNPPLAAVAAPSVAQASPAAPGPRALKLAIRQRHAGRFELPLRVQTSRAPTAEGGGTVTVLPAGRIGGQRHGWDVDGLSCLTFESGSAWSHDVASVTKPYADDGNGDACHVLRGRGFIQLAVIDGLGHGAAAERAADAVRDALDECREVPAVEAMRCAHERARGTRGAAVLLVRVHDHGLVEAVGVGNVAGGLFGHEVVSLSSRPGVVGHRLPDLHLQRLDLSGGAHLLLASDGCDSRIFSGMREDREAGSLWHRAHRLHLRHGRPTDDSTLLMYAHTAATTTAATAADLAAPPGTRHG